LRIFCYVSWSKHLLRPTISKLPLRAGDLFDNYQILPHCISLALAYEHKVFVPAGADITVGGLQKRRNRAKDQAKIG
jgi:hypothetical protein